MQLIKSLWQRRKRIRPKFDLGQCFVMDTAMDWLSPNDINRALDRHRHGDWGEVSMEFGFVNEVALANRGVLFSVYVSEDGHVFEVITQLDRLQTTVQMKAPWEYALEEEILYH